MVSIIGNRIPIQNIPAVQSDGGLGNLFDRLAAPFANRTAGAINQEKLSALQRENQGIEGLGALFASGNHDLNQMMAQGVLGGRSGADLANLNQLSVSMNNDPRSALVDQAARGAGAAFSSTAMGHGDTLANALTQTQMQQQGAMDRQQAQPFEIVGQDGVPVFTTQGAAPGQRPNTSFDEERARELNRQQAAGAIPRADLVDIVTGVSAADRAPRLWVDGQGNRYASGDGLTDIRGNPMPGDVVPASISGSAEEVIPNTDRRQFVAAEVSTRQAVDLLDRVVADLQRPDAAAALGVVGSTANVFNSVRSQLEAVTREIGGVGVQEQLAADPRINATIDGFMNDPTLIGRMQQLGVDANRMRSQILDLAYIYAVAREPGGRLSDADVARAVVTVGGGSMDPTVIAGTLGSVRETLTRNQAIRRGVFEENFGPLPGGAVPQATAPASAPAGGRPDIGAMNIEDLNALARDPSQLSDDELRAATARFRQLRGAQ